MASLIYLLLIVLVSDIVTSYHIECNYDEKSQVLSIVGINSIQDFQDYGIKCGDYMARTLEYLECYLGEIRLPLKKNTGELSHFEGDILEMRWLLYNGRIRDRCLWM